MDECKWPIYVLTGPNNDLYLKGMRAMWECPLFDCDLGGVFFRQQPPDDFAEYAKKRAWEQIIKPFIEGTSILQKVNASHRGRIDILGEVQGLRSGIRVFVGKYDYDLYFWPVYAENANESS